MLISFTQQIIKSIYEYQIENFTKNLAQNDCSVRLESVRCNLSFAHIKLEELIKELFVSLFNGENNS
jgi:hypothetical protein